MKRPITLDLRIIRIPLAIAENHIAFPIVKNDHASRYFFTEASTDDYTGVTVKYVETALSFRGTTKLLKENQFT